ncbi:MAG: lytR [Microbacteriaceae bacterium]|nr:lytR [Microbacteriaceae bacterium]
MSRQSLQQGTHLAAAPMRHGMGRTHRAGAMVVKYVAIALAVVLVSAGLVVGIAGWQLLQSGGPGVHLTGPSSKPPAIGPSDGEVNLLLTGSDTRTNQAGFQDKANLAASSGTGNNDVNILLHISNDHKDVTVVSFPRDMEVAVPACTTQAGAPVAPSSRAMLNTTLSRGGLSCVVSTIQSLTGLSVPFAAVISFDGVIAMSDAIGGVTVCLATPVKDKYTTPPLNLTAGTHSLVGPIALSFLRSRYGVGNGGDLGRISNQQVFMSALVRKVQDGGVLRDPLKLYKLATAARSNVTPTDTLNNPMTLVSIGLALKNVGAAHTVFLQYPTLADPRDANRVIPDTAAAKILNGALVSDRPVSLTGTTGVGAELPPGTSTPSPSAPTPSSPPSGTASRPASVPPSGAPVELPSTVTGQTADQQTCTKGNN